MAKIQRFMDDLSQSWEERFRALERHHQDETTILHARPRVGVAVVVWKPDGEALFGLRTGSHGANTWALPGGALEFCETVQEAGSRELREESGIQIPASAFSLGVYRSTVFEENGAQWITCFVSAQMPNDGQKPQVMEPGKCLGWQWHTWWNKPIPMFQPLRQLDLSLDEIRAWRNS